MLTPSPTQSPVCVSMIVETALAAVDALGYIAPGSDQRSTAALVTDICLGRTPPPPPHIRAHAAARAEAFTAWAAAGAAAGSQFRRKIAALTTLQAVDAHHIPALAAGVGSWAREERRRVHRRGRACSTHLGSPGERVTTHATVTSVTPMPTNHPPRRRVLFSDAAGNVLVWTATARQVPLPGQHVRLTGTVSAHDTFDGVAQTRLARCSIELPSQAS